MLCTSDRTQDLQCSKAVCKCWCDDSVTVYEIDVREIR